MTLDVQYLGSPRRRIPVQCGDGRIGAAVGRAAYWHEDAADVTPPDRPTLRYVRYLRGWRRDRLMGSRPPRPDRAGKAG